jgi:hypothetical protein
MKRAVLSKTGHTSVQTAHRFTIAAKFSFHFTVPSKLLMISILDSI